MKKGEYTPADKEMMYLTAKSRNSSRIRELLNFIELNSYKKIGIASCLSVNKYAESLKNQLIAAGLEVKMINCKESKMDSSEISTELHGASCDPKSQADYLNSEQTELNIEFGLCLGHGLIFQKYSHAPVTTIFVKDPQHQHNMVENFI